MDVLSAAATDIYLTAQDTRNLLGENLSGQILDDAGIWHDCDFEYAETISLNPGDQNFDTDFLAGLSALRYDAVYTNQGYNLPAADFDKKARINIDLSCYNMYHIDIPVLSWCNLDAVNNNSYASVAAGSFYEYYWSLSGNSTDFVESSANGNNASRFRIDGGWSPGVMCFRPEITSGSGSQYSLLTVQASCCYVGNGDHFSFYIVTPFVNDNIQWGTFTTAPVTTAPAPGSGSGDGSLVSNTFVFSWQVNPPDYYYQGTFSEYSDNFPATVSGMISDMDTYGTAAASDIAEMADYDLSGFWEFFDRMIPLRVIIAISAVSWLSLFGWILTKYRG